MKRALIAVVDAARARLFAYEEGGDPRAQLREVRTLENADRTARVGETMSNTEPGRGLAADGGTTRGYARSSTDDHREGQVAMKDHKFAKEVIEDVDARINQDGFRHLIMIAPPKMLGELRQVDGVLHRDDLQVDQVQQDLTNFSTAQLHDHLASMDLIPGRVRLAVAR
jgi:protein required for attachment to host cells